MPSRKPTLALTTPTTSSFPADALKSAASVRTPHSAIWRETSGLPSAGLPSAGLLSAGLPSAGLHSPIVAIKTEEGLLKTPISPPVAYTDFLKMHSPIASSASANFPPITSQPSAENRDAKDAKDVKDAKDARDAKDAKSKETRIVNTANTSRPRLLHRASISGPVKIAPGSSSPGLSARKMNAPAAASSTSLSSASSDEDNNTDLSTTDDALDSGPSTAASSTSAGTDCTCDCETREKEPVSAHTEKRAYKSPKIARIDTSIPASPFSANRYNFPMSAPAVGRTTFPSLNIPISPAIANMANALNGGVNPSQVNSPIRSPFSAKSAMASHFDWESALKARYAEFKSPKSQSQSQPQSQAQQSQQPRSKTSTCSKCHKLPSTPATAPIISADTSVAATSAAKTSIRHIREVVTRTVTYTPRMQAAPKGKKRKIECDEH